MTWKTEAKLDPADYTAGEHRAMVNVEYPKIRSILDPEVFAELQTDPEQMVIMEEKVDGANFRFWASDQDELCFGSRHTYIGRYGIDFGKKKPVPKESDPALGKSWKKCADFIANTLFWPRLEKSSLMVIGECVIPHTIQYDWEKTPPFIIFDVLDTKIGVFYPPVRRNEILSQLGFGKEYLAPHVGVIRAGDIKPEKLTDEFVPKSLFYDGPAEGVVFKDYQRQIFAKLVTSRFKEDAKATFGGTKKSAVDDADLVVTQYCTNARIEKQIHNLINNPFIAKEASMALMTVLPSEVLADIYHEAGMDILRSNLVVDFRKVRKLVSARCAAVLKQWLARRLTTTEPALTDISESINDYVNR